MFTIKNHKSTMKNILIKSLIVSLSLSILMSLISALTFPLNMGEEGVFDLQVTIFFQNTLSHLLVTFVACVILGYWLTKKNNEKT